MSTLFSVADLAKCAKREAGMRARVYPRWVADGRMKRETADREIAMMERIAADYTARADDEEKKERLL